MALEGLRIEPLGEEVSSVIFSWDMDHLYCPIATKLAHLEHLTLHVARVLPGGGAVAEVICTCVIGTDLDRPVLNPFPAPGIPHGGST